MSRWSNCPCTPCTTLPAPRGACKQNKVTQGNIQGRKVSKWKLHPFVSVCNFSVFFCSQYLCYLSLAEQCLQLWAAETNYYVSPIKTSVLKKSIQLPPILYSFMLIFIFRKISHAQWIHKYIHEIHLLSSLYNRTDSACVFYLKVSPSFRHFMINTFKTVWLSVCFVQGGRGEKAQHSDESQATGWLTG